MAKSKTLWDKYWAASAGAREALWPELYAYAQTHGITGPLTLEERTLYDASQGPGETPSIAEQMANWADRPVTESDRLRQLETSMGAEDFAIYQSLPKEMRAEMFPEAEGLIERGLAEETEWAEGYADRPQDSSWVRFRDTMESIGVVAGNYFLPGSSLLTSRLASEGAQERLSTPVGMLAQLGSGGVGVAQGNLANYGKILGGGGGATASPAATGATGVGLEETAALNELFGTLPQAGAGTGANIATASASNIMGLLGTGANAVTAAGTIPGLGVIGGGENLVSDFGAGVNIPGATGTQVGPGMAGALATLNTLGTGDPGAGAAGGLASGAAGGLSSLLGGEDNWLETLMSLLSGGYGMYLANQQRNLAEDAMNANPWYANQGAGGAKGAGIALTEAIGADVGLDLEQDPGYILAQRAAAATSSTQPGGYSAQAASNAAYGTYNQRVANQNNRIAVLSTPAGAGFNPMAAYNTAGNLMGGANQLAGQSLASIGYGINQAANLPWMQKYFLNQGWG